MPKLVFIADREPGKINEVCKLTQTVAAQWVQVYLCGTRNSPEGFTLHVFVGQAVVGERFIPHRIASVSQGLCTQLVGLMDVR